MKKKNQKLSEFAKQIQEKNDGSLEGGFTVLPTFDNFSLIGGTTTNNCNAGNCVAGCGKNDVQGCGEPTNQVKGCGGAYSV